MSQYYSKVYRGFLIQQTDKGWIVPQLPNWSNGPVNQGPYSTYQIACHVLDRCLDTVQEPVKPISNNEPEIINTPIESTEEGLSFLGAIAVLAIVIASFYAFFDLLTFRVHWYRFFIDIGIIIWSVSVLNKE
nr:MAG: hypothetical protein [Caudoviricetes sp.]